MDWDMIDSPSKPPVQSGWAAGDAMVARTMTSLFRIGLRLLRLKVGVPRRFGLGALLVVTGCFGALFAMLSALNTHWILVQVICCMLLIIGMLQMLRGPGKAFESSVLTGIAIMAVVGVIGGLLEPPESGTPGVIIFLLWAMIIGPAAGYLGGVLVASVFLIVDGVNHWLDRPAVPLSVRIGEPPTEGK
jgi:hypothetical protein